MAGSAMIPALTFRSARKQRRYRLEWQRRYCVRRCDLAGGFEDWRGREPDARNHNVIVDGGKLDESIANSLGDSVKYAPTIVTPPADKSVTEGETATFTVNATGTEPLSYQW
mgnify:CR=1 FL=1